MAKKDSAENKFLSLQANSAAIDRDSFTELCWDLGTLGIIEYEENQANPYIQGFFPFEKREVFASRLEKVLVKKGINPEDCCVTEFESDPDLWLG